MKQDYDSSDGANEVRVSIPSRVRVGGISKPELLETLRAHAIRLNPAAEALFDDHRFVPDVEAHVVEIAARSVADLGFVDGATYGQLTARALESGLLECPLELAPHLRLHFRDQQDDAAEADAAAGLAPPGSITVASPPLDDGDETPKGFYLRRSDGTLWLRGYWSHPSHVWAPRDVFVFSRGSAPAPDEV